MSAIAYFIGPDDAETCVEPNGGCDRAVSENPYTVDTVPEPGIVGVCASNCRHMIQLAEDAPEGQPQYTWRASLGFQEEPDATATETTSTTRTFLDDLDLEQDPAALADELKARGMTYEDVAPYLDDAEQSARLAQQFTKADPKDLIDGWLTSDDADLIAGMLLDNEDGLHYALDLAKSGFDNHQAQQAYTLADALTQATNAAYVVTMNPQDHRWYVNAK